MNCDVLMLDEPTGHLDVDNIKWLEGWFESFTGSIICTSHFTPFLDKMCTHIIDFQDRKLKTFKGVKDNTLTMFVEKYPDGRGPPVTSSTDDRELLPIHTKRGGSPTGEPHGGSPHRGAPTGEPHRCGRPQMARNGRPRMARKQEDPTGEPTGGGPHRGDPTGGPHGDPTGGGKMGWIRVLCALAGFRPLWSAARPWSGSSSVV